MSETAAFFAVRPNGQIMRVVSGGSVRECWNRLVAETGRGIAELKREGWRVERESLEQETCP